MFCTYCQITRVANEAPCPNCGAPSPLLTQSSYANREEGASTRAAWGETGANSSQLGAQWGQPIPQFSFDAPAEQANFSAAPPMWQQAGQGYAPQQTSFWQQSEEASWQQPPGQQFESASQPLAPQAPQQSFLPVPYEGDNALQISGRRSTISLQLVPEHAIQHMIPIDQAAPAEAVYVPPMYIKPRPIVPKYRVISGLLSVFIMALLVCSGAGYYAKTSGVLAKTTQFITGRHVQNLPMDSANIKDPPEQTTKDFGPAYNVIPSAVTTLNVDKNNLAKQPARVFKPNQMFYLVFSVQAPGGGKGGIVHTKWYTNDKYFKDIASEELIKPGEVKSGNIPMRFTAPLSGRVELYWNDQLALKLYFAVK